MLKENVSLIYIFWHSPLNPSLSAFPARHNALGLLIYKPPDFPKWRHVNKDYAERLWAATGDLDQVGNLQHNSCIPENILHIY